MRRGAGVSEGRPPLSSDPRGLCHARHAGAGRTIHPRDGRDMAGFNPGHIGPIFPLPPGPGRGKIRGARGSPFGFDDPVTESGRMVRLLMPY